MQIISLERALELGLDTVHVFKHGGFGDAIMLGAASREVVRQTGKPVLIGVKPVNYELLNGIDDGLSAPIYILDGYYPLIINTKNVRRMAQMGMRVNYFRQTHTGPILPEIAAAMGLSGRADLSLYMQIPDGDFDVPADKPYITIMAGGKARKAVPNRILQSVVDKYKNKYNFVQVGMYEDPLLSDVIDMRGRLSLGRGVPAVIGKSVLFVGAEGTLMHVAAATQTRSVIGDGWMGKITQNAGAIHIIPHGLLNDNKHDSPGDMETLDAAEFLNAVAAQLKESDRPFPKNIIDLTESRAAMAHVNYDSIAVAYITLALKFIRYLFRGAKYYPWAQIAQIKSKKKYGISI
ncbi:MAG: hypothetical protein FWG39_02855 [Alphaproteobacteria bacterium]|nr:hypothetical protein [Alphaproteobacteria bacterium]